MGLRQATGLTCVSCGKSFGLRPQAACPACAAPGALDVAYDYDEVSRTVDRASLERREPWLWRYRELLPIDELADEPPLQVGMTPVYGAPRLAQWAGIHGLWLKDEGRGPTGSLDDRMAAVAVVLAQESGRRILAAAGGAARSVACFAASMGLRSVAFVSADEPYAGAAAFGAAVVRVQGGAAAAVRLAAEACERFRWFAASPGSNPLLAEALKTAGLEIGEQLAERMPDWVVVADGSGLGLASVHKGLREMQALGVIKTVPRLLGIDPSESGALFAAWKAGSADGAPAGAARALEALRTSEGAMLRVERGETAEAASMTASRAAVPAGPLGAAAVAGLRRAVAEGLIPADQTALVLVADAAIELSGAGGTLVAADDVVSLEGALRQVGLVK